MSYLNLNKVRFINFGYCHSLTCKLGVVMNVRRGDPPRFSDQLVHTELTQHIADLIARIKMGGGAGIRLELNFCLYCRARLSSISVPAGYMRRGK